jgi:hypothetical protein
MTVAITASVKGSEDEAHVFCPDCFWGDDVPAAEAVQIVDEHVKTEKHIENERVGDEIQAVLERLEVERGYVV